MNERDSRETVAKSASHFLTGTFISRFVGMIRELSMAFFFGTSPALSAFLIAFRLSNLLRRLFGEGALLNGFIPYFESQRKEDPLKGAHFFRDIFWSLGFVIGVIILSLEVILGILLYSFDLNEGSLKTIHMTMIMLPGLLFICQFGLSISLLQCERSFFLPGVAPVAFNLMWILGIALFCQFSPYNAMIGISASIVVAFLLQWAVTLPGVIRYTRQFLSVKDWWHAQFFSKEIRDMILPLMLGVLGVAAVQINSAIDVILARFTSLEGPAYLSYAHRVQQLPLALFGIAISSALLPPLTRAIKEDDTRRFSELLNFGLLRTYSLLFPGMIAMFILGGASINLLYGRGMFNNLSTVNTTLCLWAYAIGLIPSAFVLLLAPAFYARKDFLTPTLGSVYSVLWNLGLSLILVFIFHLGAFSVALATAFAAYLNMRYLLNRLGLKPFRVLSSLFVKISIVTLIAGSVTLLFSHFFLGDPSLKLFLRGEDILFPRFFVDQVKHFVLPTLLFGASFFWISFLIKLDCVLDLILFKKKT